MKYEIFDTCGIRREPQFDSLEKARAWVESNPPQLRSHRRVCIVVIEAEYDRTNLPDDEAFGEDLRQWPLQITAV
jgi:hypothetical protein